MAWQEQLAPIVHAVEKRYDALKYRLYYALGGPGPMQIVAYRGYGNETRLYLKGRVLEKRNIPPADAEVSAWKDLVGMFKRLNSREVPHARLQARFQGREQQVVADEEGMFDVCLEAGRPLPRDGEWHPVELELLAPHSRRQSEPVRALGQVLVPAASAEFGVISDIDDTVVQSGTQHALHALRTILFSGARARLPFPGVAAFYRTLHAGAGGTARNPLFFVSNTLWNIYDVLLEFFHLAGIPEGPLLLRNWGVYEHELLPINQRDHKLDLIRPILRTYPDLPFLLIGDSGEVDAEIYGQIVREHPGRILAVYIRDLDPRVEKKPLTALAEEVLAAGSSLILAPDSLVMARHAAEAGWIQGHLLAVIEAEVQMDRGEF